MTVQTSFLANLLGKNTYADFKDWSKIIVPIGTIILVGFFLLSQFVYWEIISQLLSLVTGTSLLFLAYIAALIVVLDIKVDIEEPEYEFYQYKKEAPKSTAYKMTMVWGVILIILGITAIYFSNKYRKHYAFECSTVLVDRGAGKYHLDYDNDCELAAEAVSLEKMKGYELEQTNYTLCEWCQDWADDVEAEYESERYFRR